MVMLQQHGMAVSPYHDLAAVQSLEMKKDEKGTITFVP